jgi:hypothetical protein
MAEEKLDLFKTHKAEFAAKAQPALIETAPAVYLAFSGKGEPGGVEFSEGIDALFGMAFTIKMARKHAGKRDYAVGKLEARWPGFDRERNAAAPDTEHWLWQLLIRTPEFIREADLDQARTTMEQRGRAATTDRVERVRLDEGLVVQALHTGPYENEGGALDRMREFAAGKGLRPAGPHHEIYILGPRRIDPAKLKTILRIPVRVAA